MYIKRPRVKASLLLNLEAREINETKVEDIA